MRKWMKMRLTPSWVSLVVLSGLLVAANIFWVRTSAMSIPWTEQATGKTGWEIYIHRSQGWPIPVRTATIMNYFTDDQISEWGVLNQAEATDAYSKLNASTPQHWLWHSSNLVVNTAVNLFLLSVVFVFVRRIGSRNDRGGWLGTLVKRRMT